MTRTALLSVAAATLVCAAAAAQTFDQAASAGRLILDTGGDIDEASRLLAAAAAADPARASDVAVDLAWCRVEKALAALDSSRWPEADALFEEAVRIWPDAPRYIARPWAAARLQVFWTRFNAARANPGDGDRQAAVRYASDTASLAGDLPHVHYALGMALEWAGRDDDARKEYLLAAGDRAGSDRSLNHLREAAAVVATENTAVYKKPIHPLQLHYDASAAKRLERRPFVIYHNNAALAARLLNALDFHLSQPLLDGLLEANPTFPYECRVYLHRTRAEFMQVTGLPEWARGYSIAKGSAGKVDRVEIHLYQDAPRLMGDNARHELAHARLFISPLGALPLPGWVKEGVSIGAESARARRACAVTLDRARAAGALVAVRDVMNARELPSEDSSPVIYAECFAVLDTLRARGGPDNLRAFFESLSGKDPVIALRDVYGLDPSSFEDLILEWIDANR